MPDTQTLVFVKKITVTNAQLKASPSTPVTLIEAPGANKRLIVTMGLAVFKTSVPYTNIGFNGSDDGVTAFFINSFSVIPYTTVYYSLTGNPTAFFLVPGYHLYAADAIEVVQGNAWANQNRHGEGLNINSPLTLTVDNYSGNYDTDLGNFTGGDSANTIDFTFFYSISDES